MSTTVNTPGKFQCGYCQAENDVPAFASIVTCEYCGTPNEIATGKTYQQNHHMLSIYFSGSELTELIPQYLSKYVGVPEDFSDKVVFKSFELRMMPFWVFKYHGRSDYRGIGKIVSPSQSSNWSRHINFDNRPERGTIDLDQTCLIFGYREQFKEIRDEKVPIGTKEAFDIKAVHQEGGVIFDTEIGYDAAQQMAEAQVKSKHQGLIFREIFKLDGMNQQIDLKEVSYLHVPFYKVTYNYGTWEGEALVDAARGKVLRAEYPISRGHRFWGLLGTIFALGMMGIAIYLSFANLNWEIAGYCGIAIFLGFLIFVIRETFTKKRVAAE